ncbi:hypothetical protein NKI19_31865 [Mesorhizobium sp. M0751]|uniref:hypothetical protein n=1 Tax=Mesorhizobium sp. M0751 TaxID=2956992 RepID=UPI0033399136
MTLVTDLRFVRWTSSVVAADSYVIRSRLATFQTAVLFLLHISAGGADWRKSLSLMRHHPQVRWIKNSTAIERNEKLTFDRHPALNRNQFRPAVPLPPERGSGTTSKRLGGMCLKG